LTYPAPSAPVALQLFPPNSVAGDGLALFDLSGGTSASLLPLGLNVVY